MYDIYSSNNVMQLAFQSIIGKTAHIVVSSTHKAVHYLSNQTHDTTVRIASLSISRDH